MEQFFEAGKNWETKHGKITFLRNYCLGDLTMVEYRIDACYSQSLPINKFLLMIK